MIKSFRSGWVCRCAHVCCHYRNTRPFNFRMLKLVGPIQFNLRSRLQCGPLRPYKYIFKIQFNIVFDAWHFEAQLWASPYYSILSYTAEALLMRIVASFATPSAFLLINFLIYRNCSVKWWTLTNSLLLDLTWLESKKQLCAWKENQQVA